MVNYSGQIIHGTDAREPHLFLIEGIGCTLDAGGIEKGTITGIRENLGPTALGRVTASYYSSAADSGGPVCVGRQLDGFYQRSVVAIHNGSYLNASGTRAGAYGTNVKYVYQLFGTSSIYSE